MNSFPWQAAIAAALSFTAVAAFLIHLTTKEDGLGFSKVFVYGAYALAFYRKKPLYLKLSRRKTPILDTATQMLKYLGFIVCAHAQFLAFAFALKNASSTANGGTVCPAFLVLYLLLGAACSVLFAFALLKKGSVKLPRNDSRQPIALDPPRRRGNTAKMEYVSF